MQDTGTFDDKRNTILADSFVSVDDLGNLSYYCFYIPLLYWAFLRAFFREPTVSDHYSEMMVSGYFDTDT